MNRNIVSIYLKIETRLHVCGISFASHDHNNQLTKKTGTPYVIFDHISSESYESVSMQSLYFFRISEKKTVKIVSFC